MAVKGVWEVPAGVEGEHQPTSPARGYNLDFKNPHQREPSESWRSLSVLLEALDAAEAGNGRFARPVARRILAEALAYDEAPELLVGCTMPALPMPPTRLARLRPVRDRGLGRASG